jgi:hypothetical protein
VAFATSYHDAQEAMKTSYALGQMVKNAPTPPNFNNDLHNAIHFVVADHDLFPLNEPKADSSGWAREYDYTSPVSLLKQAQSGSVTDVIVMDDEDRLNFKADYVTNGGSEQPENSMAALSCGIRHTFFQEPCFKSQFIRTTTAWFWTPRTRITYYDYMLHHFCMIAEELNPNAKNIVIELTTGDKQHQLRSEGCGIDLDTIKNGQVLHH